MGADVFYLYYGVVRRIPLHSEEISQLSDDNHPIYGLAFDHKLHVTWGVIWEGEPAFLLIGTQIGVYGAENSSHSGLSDAEMDQVRRETRVKLKAAGFDEEPRLLCYLDLDC
jgi:hypothetical protein